MLDAAACMHCTAHTNCAPGMHPQVPRWPVQRCSDAGARPGAAGNHGIGRAQCRARIVAIHVWPVLCGLHDTTRQDKTRQQHRLGRNGMARECHYTRMMCVEASGLRPSLILARAERTPYSARGTTG